VIAVSIQFYSVPKWTDLFVMLLRGAKVTRTCKQGQQDEHILPAGTKDLELSSMNPVHAVTDTIALVRKI
jgi:hypothetical protein